MFELTKKEWDNLRCNFSTSSWGGSRYTPFTFSEQGVAMLSAVLNSDKAIDMNIAIMRAFIALRQIAITHYDIIGHFNELSDWLSEHDVQGYPPVIDKTKYSGKQKCSWRIVGNFAAKKSRAGLKLVSLLPA